MKKSTLFAAALLMQLGTVFGMECDCSRLIESLLDGTSVRAAGSEAIVVKLGDGRVAKVTGTHKVITPETAPGQSNDDVWKHHSFSSDVLPTVLEYLLRSNQLSDFSCEKVNAEGVIVAPKNGSFDYRPWAVFSNLWKFWTPFPHFSFVRLQVSVLSQAEFNSEMFQKETDVQRLGSNLSRWKSIPRVSANSWWPFS